MASSLDPYIHFIKHRGSNSKTNKTCSEEQEFTPESYNASPIFSNKIFRSIKRETVIKMIPVNSPLVKGNVERTTGKSIWKRVLTKIQKEEPVLKQQIKNLRVG